MITIFCARCFPWPPHTLAQACPRRETDLCCRAEGLLVCAT